MAWLWGVALGGEGVEWVDACKGGLRWQRLAALGPVKWQPLGLDAEASSPMKVVVLRS
jgi:hypothetical protein